MALLSGKRKVESFIKQRFAFKFHLAGVSGRGEPYFLFDSKPLRACTYKLSCKCTHTFTITA